MPPYEMMEKVEDPFQRISMLWFHHARILGQIYEQLYSSTACVLPTEQRVHFALSLADEVKRMIHDTERSRNELGGDNILVKDPSLVAWDLAGLKFAYLADLVAYYATLTLIYRAIPVTPNGTDPFIPECIEAGRAAFHYHIECMEVIKSFPGFQAAYIHW
jgi:hypothetical protein